MPAPIAPSNLAVSSFSSQSISLTWADNSGDETSFFIHYRSRGTNGAWSSFRTVAIPGNRTDHTIEQLIPDTDYEIEVQASNSSGVSAMSGRVTATTLGLYAKTWVNASAAGVGNVEVQVWRAPVSGRGSGEPIDYLIGQSFRADLEVGPVSGQSEAVMIVPIKVPPSTPILQNGDPLRMYMVGDVNGVETFTRISRDAVVLEAPSASVGIGGGGGTGGANDPAITGSPYIGQPLLYSAGLRSPISGSWWVVDGKRVYPTDRAFIGTDMDVGKELMAEDVVDGVGHLSTPVLLQSPPTPVAEVVEGLQAGISPVANIDGHRPQLWAPVGTRYRAENMQRMAGGGLQMITNGSYQPSHAAVLVGVDSVDHRLAWSGINQNAYWLEAQFDGSNAEYSLYEGALNMAGGLALRISRGDDVSNWQVQVIEYAADASGANESQIGATQSLSADITDVSVAIDRTRGTNAGLITVTPNTGGELTFSFTHSASGQWVVGKMLGNGGQGSPLMQISAGLDQGVAPTNIPTNDTYQTLLYREFGQMVREEIADEAGFDVEFIDKPRWWPATINEEAQVYVSGSNYRGHADNPAGGPLAHDPFEFDSAGLNVVAREATMAERLTINSQQVIHTYATQADRAALIGFTPAVGQRGPEHRVRVAADNTFWYMYPPGSGRAGQWRRVGARYLSGCLALRGIFNWKYGAFRLRFSGQAGPGVWFGAWAIPSSRIESAEIDFLETASTQASERGMVHFNTHTPDTVNQQYSSLATQQPSGLTEFPVGGDITNEHLVECDWDYDQIRWYLDGRLVHSGQNIAHEDMTVLLTLAIANGNDGFQEPYDAGDASPTPAPAPAPAGIMTNDEWHALLMSDMQGANSGLPSKLNENDGFSGGTIRAEVNTPTMQSLIEQCAGPNIYNATGGTLHNTADTLVPWGWFWEMDGNQYPDVLIVMGDMAGYVLNSANQWAQVFSGQRGYGYVNGGGFNAQNDRGPLINGIAQPARGTNLTLLKVSRLRPLELWPESFWTFQNRGLIAGMRGWHIRMVAWLEGPYKDLARIQAKQGVDVYEYQSSHPGNKRPPDDFPFRATDGGHGRYKQLTSTPQLITATTVGPTTETAGSRPPWTTQYGNGPAWPWGIVGADKLLSSSQLRANLPPMPVSLPVAQA